MKKKAAMIIVSVIAIMSFTLGIYADGIITQITATIDKELNLTFDGEEIVPVDTKGNKVPIISYNGSSYLPVRSIANLAGIDVGWDGENKTIKLIKDPVNLDNPGIMDLNKKGLVNLNYYGDKQCFTTNRTITLTNDPSDLTTKDNVRLNAGLIVDSEDSTGHTDILNFDDGEAEFNATTFKLNRNYTKMSCYVKIKNLGDTCGGNITAKVRIYDVDNDICIGSSDFSELKLKSNQESEFIKFECDVTDIDKIAIICSSEANFVDNKFIIADINFQK